MAGKATRLRVGVVVGAFALAALGNSGVAQAFDTNDADWSSYMHSVKSGFESRRWADSGYSEVMFGGCAPGSGVDVQLHRDISNWPDADYATVNFTDCFQPWIGDIVPVWSHGEWNNLPSGNYYFNVGHISGNAPYGIDVYSVQVDTDQAD